MKQFAFTVCFLLQLASALVNGYQENSAKRELKYEDWAPTHYKIYATDGEPVQHDKVLELLKELKRVYEPFDDEKTNGRKGKINKLIEVSSRNVQRCSPDHLEEMHNLVERHFSYKKGVSPYLRHHFNEYVSFCQSHVLNTNVARVETKHLTGMRKLADFIEIARLNSAAASRLNRKVIRMDYLSKGLVTFIEHETRGQLDADNLAKFNALFESHVMEMCRAWIEATDPARAINEFFVKIQFKSEEIEWLEYGNLCHAIERVQPRMMPRWFHQFKKSRSRLERLKMALKKFNCLESRQEHCS